jgi:hypothetical protein
VTLKQVNTKAVESFKAVNTRINTKKTRKWLWVSLAVFGALQMYFVQEMIAAMILFSIGFVVVGAIALFLYLFDRASQRTVAWAEPQTLRAARLARKAIVRAEEVSRKQLLRQRSQTVR